MPLMAAAPPGSCRAVRRASLIVVLLALATAPGRSAAQSVVVGGRVYDAASNSGVQNARITLTRHGGTLSDGGGAFLFQAVARGDYQLQVEAFGYERRVISLRVAGDTTLAIPLVADPFELDSIDVVLRTIDFDGRVRDPRLGAYVFEASVQSSQGHDETTSLSGRFDLDDVFEGAPLRVIIQGFGYLPLDTTFTPDDGDRYTFDLAPDPLMTRMIDRYVGRLDDRAGNRMYEYQPPMNRADLAGFSTNTPLSAAMRSRYPQHILRRIGCFFLDEQEYRFNVEGERASVFEGTFANEIERIELLEFPGFGRLIMARVYTKRFFQRHVADGTELRTPSMIETPGGIFCR